MAGIEQVVEKLQWLIDNGLIIQIGDVSIGAVELKDALTAERAGVASGALNVNGSLFPIPVGSGASTSDRQDSANKRLLDIFTRISDGSQSVKIVDGAGNVLGKIESSTGVKKTVDFTANQTSQSIWVPEGGKRFVITDALVSSSGAGQITIFDETDNTAQRVAKLNLSVNGGWGANYTKPFKSSAVNNTLKYTTGAGISGSMTIVGYEE